jgi:hypothetical protein
MNKYQIERTNIVAYELHFKHLHSNYETRLNEINGIVQSYLEDNTWHKHMFKMHYSNLSMPPWKKGPDKLKLRSSPYIWGSIEIGENADDIWFVTYILSEISNKLPDIAIRVWNFSGQFLLVEAAYSLPDWVQPEIMDHGVFIYRGKVCLISFQLNHTTTAIIDIQLIITLDIIWSIKTELLVYEDLQACIAKRFLYYPQKSKDDILSINCRLPSTIAFLICHVQRIITYAELSSLLENSKNISNLIEIKETSNMDTIEINVVIDRLLYVQHDIKETSTNKTLLLSVEKYWNNYLSKIFGLELLKNVNQNKIESSLLSRKNQVLLKPKDEFCFEEFKSRLDQVMPMLESEFKNKGPSLTIYQNGYHNDDIIRAFKTFFDGSSCLDGVDLHTDSLMEFNISHFMSKLDSKLNIPLVQKQRDQLENDLTNCDSSSTSTSTNVTESRKLINSFSESKNYIKFSEHQKEMESELQDSYVGRAVSTPLCDNATLTASLELNLVRCIILSNYSQTNALGPAATLLGFLGMHFFEKIKSNNVH